MNFSKPLIISTSLVLLAACGGGSSDSSSSNTIDQVTVVEIPNNEPVVNNEATNFFVIDTIESKFLSLDVAISADDFFENEFVDLIVSPASIITFSNYNDDDNLIEEITVDSSNTIIDTTVYTYTFDGNQVINRERARTLFNNNGEINRVVVQNTAWDGDIPLTFNSVIIDNLTDTTDEANLIYEVNDLGKVVRTFEVINGENVLSSESEFSLESNEFISFGDLSTRTFFDTTSNDIRRQNTFSYDDESNTVSVLVQFFDSTGLIVSENVDFIVHLSELNQTVVLSFDFDEFERDAIQNVTLTNFNYSEEVNSCGDYSDMAAFAFNSFIPNCITNLTFNN